MTSASHLLYPQPLFMKDVTDATSSLPSLRPLRSAGILEQYAYVRTELGFDTCIIVAARYERSTGIPLDRDTIFSALENVLNHHTALTSCLVSVSLVDSGAQARPRSWMLLPSIDLEAAVTFCGDDAGPLASVLEAQLSLPFDLDAQRPLWRITVFRDGTVVFAYDHSMGDGQSGLAFHLHLLDALQIVPDKPPRHEGRIVVNPTNAPLAPLLEDLTALPAPFTRVIHEVFDALNPFSRRKRASTWTGYPVPKNPSLRVHVRILHLSPQESARILQRCRANHATITGALYTIAAHVLAHLLNRSGARPRYKSIDVAVATSLRRFVGVSPATICNCVSGYAALRHLPAQRPSASPRLCSFPWEHAQAFSATLAREAPQSPALIGVLRRIFGQDYEGFFRGQLGKKREHSLEISNLGRVPPPFAAQPATRQENATEWKIRETVFAQANGALGAALKVNVTGTPEGGLGLTITWGVGAVDGELAEEFVMGLAEGLKELACA
ncbi:uncharacterized protein TRAVEDRAFT_23041 [Trametes versicolor FP-101664 SS1]|uniref:uncharacterized protein n=1 Tax=Trametes versicolor (strain FP-101664) TaxID=717944 RepID=UPI000462371C|nr:uncharacterized protein TRAVEDRAFT_23041 [Trametes versicolor FP-101664 SS1]EIW55329.1 hypothetical protein TRAVEDRAFT_23041 [Trametes versicolor FP-101664 SS1]